MAVFVYRIYPAVGIARIGDSDQFFLAPEKDAELHENPTVHSQTPTAGRLYRDNTAAPGKILRQAARFRIFEFKYLERDRAGTCRCQGSHFPGLGYSLVCRTGEQEVLPGWSNSVPTPTGSTQRPPPAHSTAHPLSLCRSSERCRWLEGQPGHAAARGARVGCSSLRAWRSRAPASDVGSSEECPGSNQCGLVGRPR